MMNRPAFSSRPLQPPPRRTRVGRAALAALALALAAPATAQQNAEVEDEVVARVNGAEIRFSDILLAEEELGRLIANMGREEQFRALLRHLVDRKVLAAKAREDNLQSHPDVIHRRAYYEERALSDVYWQQLLRDLVNEEDMRALYESEIASLEPEEELHARHILLDTEEDALETLARVNDGTPFEEAAKEYSTGPSAARGGDLGWFVRGQMVPEFGDAAWALAVGEVSDPVRTQFGWHLISLEGRRPRTPPAFEEIKEVLRDQKMRERGSELMSELRAKANIVIIGDSGERPLQSSEDATGQ